MELQFWHLWSLAGIALLVLEVFTTGFILGIFGVACFAGTLAALVGAGLGVQLLSFAAASALLAFTIRPLFLHYGVTRDASARTNVQALIGQQGRVLEAILPDQPGRVKVGGEDWLAVAANGAAMEPGQHVLVCGVEGCKLYVEPMRGEH